MKKFLGVVLSIIFILTYLPNVGAYTTTVITSKEQGVVVDVLDADAVVVRLYSGSRIAFARLVGVKGNAGNDAMDYMIANVLGRQVLVEPDFTSSVSLAEGRWNLVYLYLNDKGDLSTTGKELINETLVNKGYATVNEDHKNISKYGIFVSGEQEAKSKLLGVWGDTSNGWYYTGDMLNLNTATAAQIHETLSDVSTTLANKIVEYRRYNPFHNVYELKFVDGMTKKIFDSNRNAVTVVTNLNKASEKELLTLKGFTKSEVNDVIKYRNKERITSATGLYRDVNLPRSYYDDNRYFISVSDETSITYNIPDMAVNINRASASQIKEISGVTDSMASSIAGNRRNGYTYKTIQELSVLSSSLSVKDLHKYTDNFVVMTDINSAGDEELESLFGSSASSADATKIKESRRFRNLSDVEGAIGNTKYEAIKKYIYIDDYAVPDRVNLNTATESQLRAVGIPESDARLILGKQKNMKAAIDIPVSVTKYDENVALYTNINTASENELKSLNAFSSKMIDEIIRYRKDQPFGSQEEIETLFKDNSEESSFRLVSSFIVVR